MSSQIECPVCLLSIAGLFDCATTNCGHTFHTSCLMKCVSHNGFNCPYCRSNMADEEEEDDEDEEEDEPLAEPVTEDIYNQSIVVKKIELNGIKYLVAKRTGEVFDYNAYVCTGEQVEVGRWNAETQQIVLNV